MQCWYDMITNVFGVMSLLHLAITIKIKTFKGWQEKPNQIDKL